MIGKLIKGTGARGLLEYLFSEHDNKGDARPCVQIVGGTFAGQTPREIAAEFGVLQQLRPKAKKYVAHEALRLPDDDAEPDIATWNLIAERWVSEMGFEDWAAISHGDGHIHIAASRVKRDGSIVSDSQDYRRSEAAIRKIELEFGFRTIESSHLLNEDAAVDHHCAPDQGQVAYFDVTGVAPPSSQLAAIIDGLLNDGIIVTDFVKELEAVGVRVQPNVASTGRVSGFAYEYGGLKITAKAMGRGFTWSNMQKRGLSYEPNRDDETISQSNLKRKVESKEALERVGNFDRDSERLAPIRSEGRKTEQRNRQPTESVAGPRGIEPETAIGMDAQDVSRSRRDILPADDLDRLAFSAVEQQQELSRNGDWPSGSSDSRKPSDTETDSGLVAIQRHLASAVGRAGTQIERFVSTIKAKQYEVMLREPDTDSGKVTRRKWTAEQLLEPNRIRWLKARNSAGSGVFVRPIDRRFLILDDLDSAKLSRLEASNFEPCVSLETSPDNFQAWIRLIPGGLPEPSVQVSTDASRTLARLFGSDLGAVGSERFGRMPGFTNRKPKHLKSGRAPWVTIRSAVEIVATAGIKLLDAILAHLKSRDAQKRDLGRVAEGWPPVIDDDAAKSLFLQIMEQAGWEDGLTQSEVDFRACGFALKHGAGSQQVALLLERYSPDLSERHNVSDYVERTVLRAGATDFVFSKRNPTNQPINGVLHGAEMKAPNYE